MAIIGYHYYIWKDGEIEIFQGRLRDTKGANVRVEGKTYNYDSIGVYFEGDFRTEKMSEKQLEASILLLSILGLTYNGSKFCSDHELDQGKTCPVKYFPMHDMKKM